MSVGYFLAKSPREVDLASYCYDNSTHAYEDLMDKTPEGAWPKEVVVEVEFSNGRAIEVHLVEFGPPAA